MEYASVVETLRQQDHHESSWHKYEMPPELQLVTKEVSQEIHTIIKDSINHIQELKASLEQSIIRFVEQHTTPDDDSIPADVTPIAQCARGNSTSSTFTQGSLSTESRSSTEKPFTKTVPKMATNPHTPPFSPHRNIRQPKKHRLTRIFRRKATDANATSNEVTGREDVDENVAMKTPKSHKMSTALRRNVECTSCFDQIPAVSAAALKCQHSYCPPCFSQLVRTAMQTENLFPPKCCGQEVPRKMIERTLPSSEYTEFKLKDLEYSMPPGDRWYCPAAQCGKWFDKEICSWGRDIVSCPSCNTQICQSCRGLSHTKEQKCPQDRELDATIEIAELNGWRRCHRCHAIVERSIGCLHMTCRCGAEFCYICCAKWRTCRCNYDDDHRRGRELQERRAKAEAENREMRAAIAAVDKALRQERESQKREERRLRVEAAQMIAKMEAVRQETICNHYIHLAQSMSSTHKFQREAMLNRHQKERDDVQNVENDDETRSKEEEVLKDSNLVLADLSEKNEKLLRDCPLDFARQMVDTTVRQREDSDKQIRMLCTSLDQTSENEMRKAALIEDLASAQQDELRVLREQLYRNIEKVEKRTPQLQVSECPLQNSKSFRIEKNDVIQQLITECAVRHQAEMEWWDMMVQEAKSRLAENKRRLISSGAELHSFE